MEKITGLIDGVLVEVDVSEGDAISEAEELAAAREQMVVDRWQFATACALAGLITMAEAEAWAPGNGLPAGVNSALMAAITNPGLLMTAKVKALSIPTIRRNSDLIEILRADMSLTETEVDNLFIAAAALD